MLETAAPGLCLRSFLASVSSFSSAAGEVSVLLASCSRGRRGRMGKASPDRRKRRLFPVRTGGRLDRNIYHCSGQTELCTRETANFIYLTAHFLVTCPIILNLCGFPVFVEKLHWQFYKTQTAKVVFSLMELVYKFGQRGLIGKFLLPLCLSVSLLNHNQNDND